MTDPFAPTETRARHARVRGGTTSPGPNGSNLTDCGCGRRISQRLGIESHGCAAVASAYNIAREFTFDMPELLQPGAADVNGITVTLTHSDTTGEECLWREPEDTDHEFTCDDEGVERTRTGEFYMGLIARSVTTEEGSETLHPAAYIKLLLDTAESGAENCLYSALAYCQSFDPLKGGTFEWQPGNCLQLAGCFCVSASAGSFECGDCILPRTVLVTLPGTIGDPGIPFNVLFDGSELEGAEVACTGPLDSMHAEVCTEASGDCTCAWGCSLNFVEYGLANGLEVSGETSTYWQEWPESAPMCGGPSISMKTGDDSSTATILDAISVVVTVYKNSEAVSDWHLSGGDGWVIAVWLNYSVDDPPGGAPVALEAAWAVATGVPESEPCVPAGQYTLSTAALPGISTNAAFADTEVVVNIPASSNLTDINLDGIPEYQPCSGDASDDGCGLWEWVECNAGTVVCVDDGEGGLELEPAACVECCNCEGLELEGSETSVAANCNDCGVWVPLDGADATSTAPDRDGAYDGEVAPGVCL